MWVTAGNREKLYKNIKCMNPKQSEQNIRSTDNDLIQVQVKHQIFWHYVTVAV
jgi:hypothetical protein